MYQFESDPSHGWLGVPLNELIELGIHNDISVYSYYDARRSLVWLEEDCDASRFIIAKAGTTDRETIGKWLGLNTIERHTNNLSRIRNLPSFDISGVSA